MRNLLSAFALSLAVAVTPSDAQAEETPLDSRIAPETLRVFSFEEFEHDGFMLPYRIAAPMEVTDGTTYPMLLFLHGKGERGTENQRQLIHGGNLFASEAFRKRYGCYVVAPQCPDGKEPGVASTNPKDPPGTEADRLWTWPTALDETGTLDLDSSPTKQLAAVQALVDQLSKDLPIDKARIYISGLSMGGFATWELTTRDPDLYAAAIPICGSGAPSKMDRLKDLPLWVVHGELDSVVPADRSRELVAAIREAGGKPIYTELEGVGHDSWTAPLTSRLPWDWLFTQSR